MRRVPPILFISIFLCAAWGLPGPVAETARAQDRVQREIRTYVPADQVVSFLPTTSFGRFLELLNPMFQTVTGKQVVDPEQRDFPIGLTIAGLHFFDAFEMILDYNDLAYRETDQFFVIEEVPEEQDLTAQQPGTLQGQRGAAAAQQEGLLPTHETREIQINAILFELDHTKTRQLGIDWNVLFPPIGGGGQQGGGGGGQQSDERIPQLRLRTDRFVERFDDYVIAPGEVDVSFLTNLFRLLENTGAGRTLAQPSVSVQSGEEGRIQIGSDIPVTVRDFAGNAITQFVSTGIIVDVVPTLVESPLTDTADAPTLDFMHLTVQVENSTGRPFGDGIAIDRSTATTKVLLVDGEQTVIGGLYSISDDVERRGIPILKDLPPWFFGLRYVFGFERTIYSQRELLIVLQAELLDPLTARIEQPVQSDQLRENRERVRQLLRNFDEETLEELGPQLRPQNQ